MWGSWAVGGWGATTTDDDNGDDGDGDGDGGADDDDFVLGGSGAGPGPSWSRLGPGLGCPWALCGGCPELSGGGRVKTAAQRGIVCASALPRPPPSPPSAGALAFFHLHRCATRRSVGPALLRPRRAARRCDAAGAPPSRASVPRRRAGRGSRRGLFWVWAPPRGGAPRARRRAGAPGPPSGGPGGRSPSTRRAL